MHGPGYIIAWIVLVLLPICALWRRSWWPLLIYAVGLMVFIYAIVRDNGEWNDLADFTTLIVIVIPIYLVGSVVWVSMNLYKRAARKENK
ncbi:hypothetical protein [Cohnella cholangitidis]|uniref:Uncharacterized protein n=1 Tax=Cohnella cholangitidis TaxID=2598458 RepID=A0A7G5BSD5_9BACL|nr:hypothetical protein [Cohnella cholangitidis]QMV39869.1 hypothetical protein FPL14_00595 [Cohnella cholangitidis]